MAHPAKEYPQAKGFLRDREFLQDTKRVDRRDLLASFKGPSQPMVQAL